MAWELFTLAGLCMDVGGAVMIFTGITTSLQEAKKASTAYYADDEGTVTASNPSVIAQMKEGHKATIGTLLLCLGFGLQTIAPLQAILAEW